MSNTGGAFDFKKGDRVWYRGRRVRIVARTIEPALGKTYQIRYQNGTNGGYVPEADLTLTPPVGG